MREPLIWDSIESFSSIAEPNFCPTLFYKTKSLSANFCCKGFWHFFLALLLNPCSSSLVPLSTSSSLSNFLVLNLKSNIRSSSTKGSSMLTPDIIYLYSFSVSSLGLRMLVHSSKVSTPSLLASIWAIKSFISVSSSCMPWLFRPYFISSIVSS